jgi:adenylate cyclase
MAVRIEAIASHTGMTGIFRLIGSDVFAVDDIEHWPMPRPVGLTSVTGELPAEPGRAPAQRRQELWALHRLCLRMNQACDLEGMLGAVLEGLAEDFDFHHARVLLLDETGQRLFTVASRGYEESGVGSEVALGEGLIGTVARDRRLLRLGHLDSQLRYGRAARAEHALSSQAALSPEIPLPGLAGAQSHMALPLLLQDRLVGVLALESRNAASFEVWHEAFLGIVAAQVAVGIERLASADLPEEAAPAPPRSSQPAPAAARRRREVVFYKNDDCVFVDGEYLIRNVPGRILWKILRAWRQGGRIEFSNRELRLDPALGLPAIKDNLESRLILLRKRLEQKCPDIRLPSRGRGRFALELDCELALDERATA